MDALFEHEKDGDLVEHRCPVRERDRVCRHAKELGQRVEAPDLCPRGQREFRRPEREMTDLGEFDGKVGVEDVFGALPLLCRRRELALLDLVLVKVPDLADDDPRDASAKVEELRPC